MLSIIIIFHATYTLTVLVGPWRRLLLAPSSPDEDEDQHLQRLGAQLRVARQRAGLSQGQVAERLGTTQSYVSEVESGQVNLSLKAIIRFGRAVGCIPLIHMLPTGLVTAEELMEFGREVNYVLATAPTNPTTTWEHVERSIEEIHFLLSGLRDHLIKLRSPAQHLTEAAPRRPRRGRRPKKRTPEDG